jgi:hypothetical protein
MSKKTHEEQWDEFVSEFEEYKQDIPMADDESIDILDEDSFDDAIGLIEGE